MGKTHELVDVRRQLLPDDLREPREEAGLTVAGDLEGEGRTQLALQNSGAIHFGTGEIREIIRNCSHENYERNSRSTRRRNHQGQC